MAASATRLAAGTFAQLRRTPRTIRMPAFRSLAPTVPTEIVCPLGVTYQALEFRFTIAGAAASEAQILAQVDEFKCTIDGDTKLQLSAAEIAAIQNCWAQRWNGQTNSIGGVFVINLSRPFDQEIEAQDGPAWGCAVGVEGGVGTFTLSVRTIAGATIDGVECFAEVTPPTPLGRHLVYRSIGGQFTSAGDLIISDWPRLDLDVQMYALHLQKSGGVGNLITEVQFKVDQVDEIERCRYEYIQAQFRRYGLVQQAGWVHIPFARRGRPLEGMPAVWQDGRLTLAASASLGNYKLIMEQLEGVDPATAG